MSIVIRGIQEFFSVRSTFVPDTVNVQDQTAVLVAFDKYFLAKSRCISGIAFHSICISGELALGIYCAMYEAPGYAVVSFIVGGYTTLAVVKSANTYRAVSVAIGALGTQTPHDWTAVLRNRFMLRFITPDLTEPKVPLDRDFNADDWIEGQLEWRRIAMKITGVCFYTAAFVSVVSIDKPIVHPVGVGLLLGFFWTMTLVAAARTAHLFRTLKLVKPILDLYTGTPAFKTWLSERSIIRILTPAEIAEQHRVYLTESVVNNAGSV